MKRSGIVRTTPLKAGSSRLQSRTRLRKSGAVKAKRVKRQRNHYASKYWKTIRCLIYQRDGGICQDCGVQLDSIDDMEAAHTTNARFGQENLDDVICSCRPCNQAERASRSWYAGPIAR